MRARAAHGTLALLHLHHTLFHSAVEILTGLAHVYLGRRDLLDDTLRKWMLAAILPLRIQLLVI